MIVRVAVAARTDVQSPEGTSARREVVTNGASVFHELAVPVREGQAVTVSKIAAVHTSRDRAISEPVEACRSEVGRAPVFDELLERPRNERPMMLVVTGYPAADARVPRLRRKSLQEVVSFR